MNQIGLYSCDVRVTTSKDGWTCTSGFPSFYVQAVSPEHAINLCYDMFKNQTDAKLIHMVVLRSGETPSFDLMDNYLSETRGIKDV